MKGATVSLFFFCFFVNLKFDIFLAFITTEVNVQNSVEECCSTMAKRSTKILLYYHDFSAARFWKIFRPFSAMSQCSQNTFMVHQIFDGLYIFYSNLWNLSSDIWAQPSGMSDMSNDFHEHWCHPMKCDFHWEVIILSFMFMPSW